MEHPLIQSLFDDLEPKPLSVTELNLDIKAALEQRFNNVWVEGEISNFSMASSGHWYFSLTDGESFIKAVCFKGTNWRIRFKPFDGLQVRNWNFSFRSKALFTRFARASIVLRAVEISAWRKILVAAEMLRPKRLRNLVFFSKPLAQIHQLAAFRAKGPIFGFKPCAPLLACRTADYRT